MTTYYLDSNSASEASAYNTWAKGAHLIATLWAIDAAGDTIWAASNHAESSGAINAMAWAGTAASPTRLSCGTTAAEPPTTSAETASITTTSGDIRLGVTASAVAIWEGFKFITIDANTFGNLVVHAGNDMHTTMRNCIFQFGNSSFQHLYLNYSASSTAVFEDCTIKWGHASQNFEADQAGNKGIFRGLTIDAGGAAITKMFALYAGCCELDFSGCNLAACAASLNFLADTHPSTKLRVTNCKLPGSWSGALNSSTPGRGSTFELDNCDSGDTHYNYIWQTDAGTSVDESTLVMTGGAADRDAHALSLRVDTNAYASGLFPFYSKEMVIDNLTVGSSVTVTVPFLHDSATNMTNAEIYVEVMLFTTSGVPLGTWYRDDVKTDNSGNRLASAADQASSSETWTTTGMSNPNKQECSVSATIQEAGYIVARLAICKASKTLYYNFPPTIS